MNYLNWQTKMVPSATATDIDNLYDEGFVATRVAKEIFNQTRSIRVPLAGFELSSENRRILRKAEGVTMKSVDLPYKDYHWSIHKLAKTFYDQFGKDTFSANKIKDLLTSPNGYHFNKLLIYSDAGGTAIGYAICVETPTLLHYSYPFYHVGVAEKNPSIGLAMMIMAISYAVERHMTYAYLGSLQRPSDTYKLQFANLEWFDGERWIRDIETIKKVLREGVSTSL